MGDRALGAGEVRRIRYERLPDGQRQHFSFFYRETGHHQGEMIESFRRVGKKWPRGQRFRLTPKGQTAESAYKEAIGVGRRGDGTSSLELMQAAWAQSHGIEPGDGLFITELGQGERTLAELAEGLESCGTSLPQVKAAIERLIESGIVEPLSLSVDPHSG